MTKTQRRGVLAAAIGGAAALAAWAYYGALVPATHPDHDHGILNLDAGGRLMVTARDGKSRNLVGRPGHALVLHFFDTRAPGAADELAALFAFQKSVAPEPGDAARVEWVLIAREPDFATLDAWLAQNKLAPPDPAQLVLDPAGETTSKLNSKRPLETMFFNADGKLADQARGRLEWALDAAPRLERARKGETLE